MINNAQVYAYNITRTRHVRVHLVYFFNYYIHVQRTVLLP